MFLAAVCACCIYQAYYRRKFHGQNFLIRTDLTKNTSIVLHSTNAFSYPTVLHSGYQKRAEKRIRGVQQKPMRTSAISSEYSSTMERNEHDGMFHYALFDRGVPRSITRDTLNTTVESCPGLDQQQQQQHQQMDPNLYPIDNFPRSITHYQLSGTKQTPFGLRIVSLREKQSQCTDSQPITVSFGATTAPPVTKSKSFYSVDSIGANANNNRAHLVNTHFGPESLVDHSALENQVGVSYAKPATNEQGTRSSSFGQLVDTRKS